MTIEFQNTKKDYLNYFKNVYIYKNASNIVKTMIVALLLYLVYSIQEGYWLYNLVVISILWTIFVGSLYFRPYFQALKQLESSIIDDEYFYETKRLTVKDDCLNLEYNKQSLNLFWGNILSVNIQSGFVTILLADKKSFILIPINCFMSNQEMDSFIEIIQKRIIDFSNSGGVLEYQKPKMEIIETNVKPPYALGLFCLIPFWGGLIGVLFIWYGLYKVKSKALIIIGSIGVVLNIVFFVLNQFYHFYK